MSSQYFPKCWNEIFLLAHILSCWSVSSETSAWASGNHDTELWSPITSLPHLSPLRIKCTCYIQITGFSTVSILQFNCIQHMPSLHVCCSSSMFSIAFCIYCTAYWGLFEALSSKISEGMHWFSATFFQLFLYHLISLEMYAAVTTMMLSCLYPSSADITLMMVSKVVFVPTF